MINSALQWLRTPTDEISVALFACWIFGMFLLLWPLSYLPDPWDIRVALAVSALVGLIAAMGVSRFFVSLAWPITDPISDLYATELTKWRIRR